MMAAKVADEDTRKDFMGRVRELKACQRALAPYTTAPPWGWLAGVFGEGRGGEVDNPRETYQEETDCPSDGSSSESGIVMSLFFFFRENLHGEVSL
jgi:hypothetical protein